MSLSLTHALLLLASAVTVMGACRSTEVRERREIHELSDAELQRYISAVRCLMKVPMQGTNWTVHENFAVIHNQASPNIHGSAQFLPWHRYFLLQYENALRRFCDSSVTVPYWDSTASFTDITKDIVLSTSYFGDSSTRADRCVTQGNFANLAMTSSNRCLRRSYGAGSSTASRSHYQEALSYKTFSGMAQRLEYSHNFLHAAVGGSMGGMFSPFDPLFYLHHAFVDYLWDDWQADNSAFADYSESVSSSLSNYPVTVSGVLDSEDLCVSYGRTRVIAVIPSNITVSMPNVTNLTMGMGMGMGNQTHSNATVIIADEFKNVTDRVNDALKNATQSNETVVDVKDVGRVDKSVQQPSVVIDKSIPLVKSAAMMACAPSFLALALLSLLQLLVLL